MAATFSRVVLARHRRADVPSSSIPRTMPHRPPMHLARREAPDESVRVGEDGLEQASDLLLVLLLHVAANGPIGDRTGDPTSAGCVRELLLAACLAATLLAVLTTNKTSQSPHLARFSLTTPVIWSAARLIVRYCRLTVVPSLQRTAGRLVLSG